MESSLAVILTIFAVILALKIKAIRKSTGLVLIVAGIILSFTIIGMIIGLPMIFIGGLLLFI